MTSVVALDVYQVFTDVAGVQYPYEVFGVLMTCLHCNVLHELDQKHHFLSQVHRLTCEQYQGRSFGDDDAGSVPAASVPKKSLLRLVVKVDTCLLPGDQVIALVQADVICRFPMFGSEPPDVDVAVSGIASHPIFVSVRSGENHVSVGMNIEFVFFV